MQIAQKTRYALRAIFELSKRTGEGPIKIAEIAEIQAIPPRFLEVILSQLKNGGFVDARRGSEGGYFLLREPSGLTVGEIIRFIDGPISPVGCGLNNNDECDLNGECVFLPMWQKVQKAIAEVYDSTTFSKLVEDEKEKSRYIPSYTI